MREHSVLQQEDLDALLALLSQDREEAGKAYEDLRKGLVRYFSSKGCPDSHHLADETLTRVATKATAFDSSLNVKPSSFVYGFASRVFLEYMRGPEKRAVEFDPAIHSPASSFELSDEGDGSIDCLDECLSKYPADERSMIVRYYSKEKQEKIELRRRMAEEYGCKVEVLHMRVHRMRAALKTCVSRCLAKKGYISTVSGNRY
jgi:DNA-directed RNA polymerase specialized sigma24 family protein